MADERCDNPKCRDELAAAEQYCNLLERQLEDAKRELRQSGGRRAGGFDDEGGRSSDLEGQVARLEEANEKLHDEVERYREREVASKQQVADLQRDIRLAQAARVDAEESVTRMQAQLQLYDRDLQRCVRWPCGRGTTAAFKTTGRDLCSVLITRVAGCARGGVCLRSAARRRLHTTRQFTTPGMLRTGSFTAESWKRRTPCIPSRFL